MQENVKITPEEERRMKWALVIAVLIIIIALTAGSLHDFIEGIAGLGLMILIIRGVIWFGNRVW